MAEFTLSHAKGVSEIDIAAFKEQLPENVRSSRMIVIEEPLMPEKLIVVSADPMKVRAFDLINKR